MSQTKQKSMHTNLLRSMCMLHLRNMFFMNSMKCTSSKRSTKNLLSKKSTKRSFSMNIMKCT
jgi:hypothetical protein